MKTFQVADLDDDMKAALLETLEDLEALDGPDDDDLAEIDDDAARVADGAAHLSAGLGLFSGMPEARKLRRAIQQSVEHARRRAGVTRNYRDSIRQIHELAAAMRERVEAEDGE